MQQRNSDRPGVIGETKSSLLGAFGFLAALPANISSQLNASSAEEAGHATPGTAASDNPVPNIFENDKRDNVDPKKTKVEPGNEGELKGKPGQSGLNETKTKGMQMSHRWIRLSLPAERLTPAGLALARAVVAYRKRFALGEVNSMPYARSIIMVAGRQKTSARTRPRTSARSPTTAGHAVADISGFCRREPYCESHVKGREHSFLGHWSFEAAAVVYVLDIDDSTFRDHEFYPRDLADFARCGLPRPVALGGAPGGTSDGVRPPSSHRLRSGDGPRR